MTDFWSQLLPKTYVSKILFHPNGTQIKGDKISPTTVRELTEILHEQNGSRGTVTLKKNGSLVFSSDIPKSCHQRMRNLI